MSDRRRFIYDIETFSNLFTLCGRFAGEDKTYQFYIYEDDKHDTAEELFLFLFECEELVPTTFVGYNNLDFDNQVVEHIYKYGITDAREIYRWTQEEIIGCDRFELPYPQWEFKFKQMDLMKMWNFGIGAKATSLKWTEFSMRKQHIADLPFHHSREVKEKEIPEILKYNVRDIDQTEAFYNESLQMIAMRNTLIGKYKDPFIMNQPNSSIGEKIVRYSYADALSMDPREVKKIKPTRHKKIAVADVIEPWVSFDDEQFQEVFDGFNELVLKAGKGGVIKIKDVYEKEIEWKGLHIKFGLGGIHGCVPSGIYRSTATHVIKTYDVTGMYPNIAIANGFYPRQLGKEFCKVYKNILMERKKYPKSENLEMNLAYKEAANSVYGKSNATHDGFLKDPFYTLQTTINGQLALSMLSERLSTLGDFLIMNTDGSEMLLPRDKEEEYQRICDEWCEQTGIELEHDEYETLWIKDVNNYIGKFVGGKVKRKGAVFCTYDDYKGNWNKNPSGLVVAEAINAYFIEGKDPADVISNWDNIYDFLYGIKGGSNYDYWLYHVKDNIIEKVDQLQVRALRYYVAKDGQNLRKFWRSGKKATGTNTSETVAGTKGVLIQTLQNVPDMAGEVFRKKTSGRGKDKVTVYESRYPDLDYEHYIREAWKWINVVEKGDILSEEESEVHADI